MPGQERIQNSQKTKNLIAFSLRLSPIHKLNMTFMVWNISIGQTGYLSGSAPSQLLHICCLAEYEKVLDFIATTENISVINIVLVLNLKYIRYWEENDLYPS